MTIECLKYTPINRGTLLGFADFYVPKMALEVYGCQLHQKEGRRWINMPSKEYINDSGEKKFAPVIRFRERAHMDAFAEACKAAIDKVVKDYGTKPQPVNEVQDDLPF